MDFKTENIAFFLFFLLGKDKANYLCRKVILQKIFRVFQGCNFMRKNFQDKAGNFYCVPANFYLMARQFLFSSAERLFNSVEHLFSSAEHIFNTAE